MGRPHALTVELGIIVLSGEPPGEQGDEREDGHQHDEKKIDAEEGSERRPVRSSTRERPHRPPQASSLIVSFGH